MISWIRRVAVAIGGAALLATTAAAQDADKTVVLVHGAWADGSSWSRVIPYLHEAGLRVVAVQNPLTGFEDDVAATARVIADQPGDVVLVGHSYGGMVISEAGKSDKVKALVYVAAFSPKPGQSVNAILSAFPPPPWLAQLHVDGGGYVTWPEGPMASEFSSGLSAEDARLVFAVQHPTFHAVNDGAVGDTVAWQGRPVWSLVAEQDHVIPGPLQMAFAQQMNATVSAVPTGHLPMFSDPRAVADTIIAAARSF
jgi:pimeloyl-ACP methyl ester carboxylesterase